jgi:hypothetical protein
MNNRRSALIILLLRNPRFLEARQTSNDRPPNPGTVSPFGEGDDSYTHGVWRKEGELFGHAVSNARAPGCSTGQND